MKFLYIVKTILFIYFIITIEPLKADEHDPDTRTDVYTPQNKPVPAAIMEWDYDNVYLRERDTYLEAWIIDLEYDAKIYMI